MEKNLKLAIAVCVAISLILILVFASISYIYRIHNVGNIKTVGVAFFFDAGLTQNATSIDWNTVEPAVTYSRLLYCKNMETANVTLSLMVTNWNPSNANHYITASWNYTGAVLRVGQARPILFLLSVAANITGFKTFSFEYVVTATG